MPAIVSTYVPRLASTLSVHRSALLHEHLQFLQSIVAPRILDSHERQQHGWHSHGQCNNLIKSQAGEMFTVTASRTAAACRWRTCRCRQEWRRLPWRCGPYFASVKPSLHPVCAPSHTSGTAPGRRCRCNTVLGQVDTAPSTKLRDRLVDTAGATFRVRREMHANIVVYIAESVGADAATVGLQRQVRGAA